MIGKWLKIKLSAIIFIKGMELFSHVNHLTFKHWGGVSGKGDGVKGNEGGVGGKGSGKGE